MLCTFFSFLCILPRLMNKLCASSCSRWFYLKTEAHEQILTMRTRRFSSILLSLECWKVINLLCLLRITFLQFHLPVALHIRYDLLVRPFQLDESPFCSSFVHSLVPSEKQWLRDYHMQPRNAIRYFDWSHFCQFCTLLQWSCKKIHCYGFSRLSWLEFFCVYPKNG